MSGWAAQRERGHVLTAGLMLQIARIGGQRVARALLYPIVAFYFIAAPEARRASRLFLSRAMSGAAGWRDVAAHLMTFAEVLLDRVFLANGDCGAYRFEVNGLDELRATLAQGRGCLLLGSHFGSFEALRAFGRTAPVRAKALMYRHEIGPYTRLIEALDPGALDDVIDLGCSDAMLRAQEALNRGEIVCLLADRAPGGARGVPAPFFGRVAPFPSGPVLVAALLQAPVMLVFCPRTAPRSYAVSFAPFADRIALPRASRMEALEEWVKDYAAALECRVREAPYNWFNFYDFWNEGAEAAAGGGGRSADVSRAVARGIA